MYCLGILNTENITKSTQTNYSESEARFEFIISRMPKTVPHVRYRGQEFAKTNIKKKIKKAIIY